VVRPLLDSRNGIGLALGVVSGGVRRVFAYGRPGGKHTEPVDGRTIFEVGSLTKPFTAALLALTVEEGLMNFDTPVCSLLPELRNLPRTITPLRLATHTSGLPRLPPQFFLRSWIWSPRNPYAAFTADDLLAALSRHESRKSDAAELNGSYRYSNLGYGLLGYILARIRDMSYERAVTRHLCDPLQMGDTRVTLSAAQQERLALPHGSWGGSTSNWDMGSLEGAGALHSTVRDMLEFVAANLGGGPAPLVRALDACHELQLELTRPQRGGWSVIGRWLSHRILGNIPPPCGITAGWHLSRLQPESDTVHWHNGDTGGYRAFAGFFRTAGIGVVVLSNRGPGTYDLVSRAPSVTEIGFNLLRRLIRDKPGGRAGLRRHD
jgi:serine-type D-Ala-D-Ala carboxypeptidase/endopeptidase